MTRPRLLWTLLILFGSIGSLQSACGQTDQHLQTAEVRDGQHDFDFNLGTWKTHIRTLRPTGGDMAWVEFNGTVAVQKVWDGRAQLEEIEATGPGGAHFEGLTLFLYDPKAHQWSESFSNSSEGTIRTPMIGAFHNGQGEFYSQQMYQGKVVLFRQVWSEIAPDSHHLEQSFSEDGGKTWKPNFIAELTRLKE